MIPYRPSNGVTVTIVSATSAGWSADGRRARPHGQTCAIFYGVAPPIPPAVVDAAVACT